ncbi:hypothetical protein ACR9YC_12590 [Parasphingorhabdus sp. DH2-15]|uniref:hypothetical protein n=1 Tax=Parasphingorhabdus sp. DH2-15 TaxID=3444112 RepID=UPI003F688500
MIISSSIAALALALNVMPIQPFIQDGTQEPEAKSFEQEAPPEFAPSLQLSLEQKADVKCAVAFAIVAGGQERGEASALAYPLLGERGRTFFADLGQRLIKDLDATPQQVQLVLESEARALQEDALETNDPNGTVDAIMEPCLSRLDAVIPPPPEPSLPECAAIMELAYDEVFAREGLSPTARDLKTLASVLDSRARDELRAEGKSGNEIDIALSATKAAFAAEVLALEAEGKSPNLDYDYCFELAKP